MGFSLCFTLSCKDTCCLMGEMLHQSISEREREHLAIYLLTKNECMHSLRGDDYNKQEEVTSLLEGTGIQKTVYKHVWAVGSW